MKDAAQYTKSRRTRAACVIEFLALAALAGVVVLAAVVWGVATLVEATSVRTVAWWGFVAVLLAGAAFILFWLGVLEYWNGRPWRELAGVGRGGQAQRVRTDDGIDLYVEVEGPAHAQVTVVFVHGIALNAGAWRNQRSALAESSVRRVFYDARGHGESGTRKLDQKIRGVRQLAADLGAVVDATAPTGRLVIVGHSLGGLTTLALPAVRPDLVERVDGYVLCSASAGRLGRTMSFGLWRVFAPVAWLLRREAAGFLCVVDALPRFALRILGLMPYLVGLRYLAVHGRNSKSALRPTAAIVYGNGFRQTGDVVAAVLDHDERPALAALGGAHVAVIKGSHDHCVPSGDQQFLADNISRARLTVVPDCGHMPIFEAADTVNDEILRIVDLVVADAEPAHAPEVIPAPALAPATLVGRAPGAVSHLAQSALAPTGLTNLAASGVDAVSGALGEIAETVERFTPAGPIREGVHSLHKRLNVDHPVKPESTQQS